MQCIVKIHRILSKLKQLDLVFTVLFMLDLTDYATDD